MAPVTDVVGEFGKLIIGVIPVGPLTYVQVPCPTTGVLPVSIKLLPQAFNWSAPTVAVVGVALTVILT